MLNPSFCLEQAEWSREDINTSAFATALWIKKAFKSYGTEGWDDDSLGRITQSLEMRDSRPVSFQGRGFDLRFYGLNQPFQMEFDPEKGFVWRAREPRFVLEEKGLPLNLSERFARIFGLLSGKLSEKYNLSVQNFPKSLIFSTDHYAWGITEFPNTLPLSALIGHRQ